MIKILFCFLLWIEKKRMIFFDGKNMEIYEFAAFCAKSLADGEKSITTDTE